VSAFALGLVLASAVIHASWNLVTKRTQSDVAFLWVVYVIGSIAYAPLAVLVIVVARPQISPLVLLFVVVSAILQVVYFGALTAGYRAGDLSLVYPVARATGPLLATAGAIALFGERPSGLALAGAVAILGGALGLTGDPRALRASGAGRAVGFAVATGVVIALYTLWDKTAVSGLLVPPLLYDWATVTLQALFVAPVALRDRSRLREVWATQRREVVGVGVASRLSYILALTALAVSPVAYVAPAREVGILIGALLGARVLAEGHLVRRGLGAAAMVAGVVALAVG